MLNVYAIVQKSQILNLLSYKIKKQSKSTPKFVPELGIFPFVCAGSLSHSHFLQGHLIRMVQLVLFSDYDKLKCLQ